VSDSSETSYRRIFTLTEAKALLPRVGELLERSREQRGQALAAHEALTGIPIPDRSNGHQAEAVSLERRLGDAISELEQSLRELHGMGIEVKDLDHGIVDFPAWRDDRVVFLCWRLGEPTIAFWHELNSGFQGRRALDRPFEDRAP
jgi:hypothetical protein